MVTLNGREVTDIEVDDVDPSDYPDFCDAYFSYAVFEDTKEVLTDEELEKLTDENPDVVNPLVEDRVIVVSVAPIAPSRTAVVEFSCPD